MSLLNKQVRKSVSPQQRAILEEFEAFFPSLYCFSFSLVALKEAIVSVVSFHEYFLLPPRELIPNWIVAAIDMLLLE